MKTFSILVHPRLASIAILIMISTFTLLSQQDVRVRMADADLNQALLALTSSRSLNFGDYEITFATQGYFVNIDAATIHITPGNRATINASATYVEVFRDWVPGNEQQPIHGSVTMQGDLSIRLAGTGYKLLFHATDVDLSLFSISLSVGQFLGNMPEVEINIGSSLLPDAITSYFTSTTPTLTTNNGELILYFTATGPRNIKAYNEVNQKNNVGNVEEYYVGSYPSPHSFWWNPGTTHGLQTPQPLLSETNGMNKYRNWFDITKTQPETDVAPRRISITVNNDATYKAKFDQAQHVQLSNASFDGGASGGTVTYEYSPGVTTTSSTVDDYDYNYSNYPYSLSHRHKRSQRYKWL